MTLDDTDDKIRRNLVVISAAILLSAWLDVSLANLLMKIIDAGVAHESRFIAAAGALLVYTAARFKHSKEGLQYRASMARAINKEITRLGNIELSREVIRSQNGLLPTKLLGTALVDARQIVIERNVEHGAETFEVSVGVFQIASAKWTSSRSSFLVELKVEASAPDAMQQGHQFTAEARPRGWLRLRMMSSGYATAWLNTKDGIQLQIPVLLGLAAASTILWRACSQYVR